MVAPGRPGEVLAAWRTVLVSGRGIFVSGCPNVIHGGGASLEGVRELAADIFAMGVRIGTPGDKLDGLAEQVAEPQFATAVGLALYGAHRVALGGVSGRKRRGGAGVDGLVSRARTWLQDFF